MKYRRIRLGQLGNSRVIDFAVQELYRYLKRMDPVLQIEIMKTEYLENSLPRVIWVGLDDTLRGNIPAVQEPELDDAIYISVDRNGGCITGSNQRSVLIGVYRFLKALGCNWVRPGREGERIPQKVLDNISVSVCEVASYRHRGISIEGANSYENVADMIDYLPKVGMNEYHMQFMVPGAFFERWYAPKRNPLIESEELSREEVAAMTVSLEGEITRRGLRYHKVGHGWTCEAFGISGTSWDEVDASGNILQYVAELDGCRGSDRIKPLHTNLCYSNPDVRSIMTDYVVRYCSENQHVDVLHFWLGDSINNQCECEECRKKRPSDWYVMMLNELDQKLTEQGLNTKIVFLLYYDLLWAPAEEKLINPDRFILMFAPIDRMYGQCYSDYVNSHEVISPYIRNQLHAPQSLAENLAYLRSWQERFQGDSFVYDYHLMWAHVVDFGYEACAKNLFEDMKSLDQIGLNGMVSCQVQRCAFPTGLPVYMMAAALWDKNSDYHSLVDEYYHDAFGLDGAYVHRYLSQISESIQIYESVAHKYPLFETFPSNDDYTLVEQAITDILPVIEKNINSSKVEDWQSLKLHTDYVDHILLCLKMMEKGDMSALKKAAISLRDFINVNEQFIQKQIDGQNTLRVLFLRMGLSKKVLASISD